MNLGSDERVVPRMTSYIAHHTKKRQILARREAALRRLIDTGAAMAKLIAAAEVVRDARVRVLKVQRSNIFPTNDADLYYAKIDSKIEAMANTSVSTILAEFGIACELDISEEPMQS